jgi:hypothetical protein
MKALFFVYVPRFPNDSPARPFDYSSIKIKISVEQWRNNTDKGKQGTRSQTGRNVKLFAKNSTHLFQAAKLSIRANRPSPNCLIHGSAIEEPTLVKILFHLIPIFGKNIAF